MYLFFMAKGVVYLSCQQHTPILLHLRRRSIPYSMISGQIKGEFQEHLRSHYDYRCLKCDYTSRTEGRLRRHVKDFHSDVPPDNFSGKAIKPVRPKLQRCKQCDFTTETKVRYFEFKG